MLSRERSREIANAFIEWLHSDQVTPFEEKIQKYGISIEEFNKWKHAAAERIAEALKKNS